MSRLARWLLFGTLAFVVLLGGLLAAALYSETVFRWAIDAAEPLIPGELAYESLEGSLAGPVNATGVEYTIDGTRVSVGKLGFDLSPSALLGNRIRIRSLDARDVTVTLPPPKAESEGDAPASPGDVIRKLALPVQLDIPGATLRDVHVQRANGEELLALEQLTLSLHWGERRIAIDDLDASGPALDAKGDAALGLSENARTELDLGFRWQGEPVALGGRVTAEGDPERLELNVDLDAPAEAELHATLFDLLETPRWQGTLAVNELMLDALRPSLPSVAWWTQLAFEGDWQDTALNGTIRGGWPQVTGIDLAIDGRVNAQRLQLENIAGTIGALEASVDAEGVLHYADELRYAVKGEFDRLSWPGFEDFALRDGAFDVSGDTESLQGVAQASAGNTDNSRLQASGQLAFDELRFDASARGHDLAFTFNGKPVEILQLDATAEGIPSDYRLRADVRADVADLPVAHVVATAEGNTRALDANIRTLEWLNGRASGDVHLDWQDALSVDAQLQARGFELDALDPQLAGVIGGRFSVSADFSGDQPTVSVDIASLDGKLDGLDIEGSGSVRLANGRLATRGLNIVAGENRLALDDAAGAGFDFTLDAPALARLHAGLAGELHASGHIEGVLDSPTFSVEAKGSGLRWQDWQADDISLNATVRNGGRQQSEIHLAGRAVETPWIGAQQLDLDASGQLDDHQIELTLDGAGNDNNGQLTFAAAGAWQQGQWRGDIDRLRFEHPLTGEWSLANAEAEKRIVLGPDTVQLPEHCLQGPQGHACIGPASGSFQELSMQGRLEAIPVSVLAAWLPAGLEYEGSVSGRFNVRPGTTGLQGKATLRLTSGGILQTVGEGFETLLGWHGGEAAINFKGDTATASLAIDLLDEGRISGDAELSLAGPGPRAIDASLRARIGNLQLIPSLVPELSRVRGTITANLDVTGTLSEPRIKGSARLRNGSARILALGADWDNIDLVLEANGQRISGTGHIESGNGHIDIELSGRDTGDSFTGKATIVGEDFKAMQTPEANIDIAPNLNVELKGRDLYIDGEVFVPMARIEPRDLTAAAQVSEDQVIVNEQAQAEERKLRIHAAITTRLGDQVRLQGFGLTARLEGRVTVSQQPGNPPTGNGKLIVAEGQYKAYGQDLTLAKGEIIYTGQPVTNPGLDIRAERHPNPDTMVGVSVRGPLSNPTTSIYSDPVMSETAALGLLLFGRTIEDATSSQEQQINEASVALGLGGGKLLDRVGQKLGLEEVSVQDIGNTDRASLVLGKYLSPDLYVSYGIGLYEAVNTFRVRYRISRRWTLEATSGLKSSADFIYTIER